MVVAASVASCGTNLARASSTSERVDCSSVVAIHAEVGRERDGDKEERVSIENESREKERER